MLLDPPSPGGAACTRRLAQFQIPGCQATEGRYIFRNQNVDKNRQSVGPDSRGRSRPFSRCFEQRVVSREVQRDKAGPSCPAGLATTAERRTSTLGSASAWLPQVKNADWAAEPGSLLCAPGPAHRDPSPAHHDPGPAHRDPAPHLAVAPPTVPEPRPPGPRPSPCRGPAHRALATPTVAPFPLQAEAGARL